MNHHYRRLSSAKPHINTGRRPTTAKTLSKSCHDVRCCQDEGALQNNRFGSDFNIDSPAQRDKKSSLADESCDVLSRHNQYFTQPKQLFTPRLVRKIVRPATSHSTRAREMRVPYLMSDNPAEKSVSFHLDNARRNVSDDSALEEDHSSQCSVSTIGTNELISYKFRKWLKEQ